MTQGTVKSELERLGVRATRSRGQNFLKDEALARQIVSSAGVTGAEVVVEIGPGLGILTAILVPLSKRFIAIELQQEFATTLALRYPNSEIVQRDVREVALGELLPHGERAVVVGNIPYSISTDVVLWFIREAPHIRHANFLFQREFSERLAAGPGGREYSSLTVKREVFATARLGDVVPGTAFHPPTKVESRIVRLTPRAAPLVSGAEEVRLEEVVRAAFSKRRKTLLNALAGSQHFPVKEQLRTILASLGIDEKRRPETLSFDEFRAISNSSV